METERKHRLTDPRAIEKQLGAAGFRSEGWHFETNSVYDTQALALYEKDSLLRIRTQEWPRSQKAILTYKGPADERIAREEGLKTREEVEVEVGSAQTAAVLLAKLGYEPVARYEKLRSEWRSPAEPEIVVDLDLLPFGAFLEIEGPLAAIARIEQLLGLDKSEIGLKSYHELNQEWRNENGLPFCRDFVFDADEKQRLRKWSGLS